MRGEGKSCGEPGNSGSCLHVWGTSWLLAGSGESGWGRLPLKRTLLVVHGVSGRRCRVSCGQHVTGRLGVASGRVLRALSAPASAAFLTGKEKLLPRGCVLEEK